MLYKTVPSRRCTSSTLLVHCHSEEKQPSGETSTTIRPKRDPFHHSLAKPLVIWSPSVFSLFHSSFPLCEATLGKGFANDFSSLIFGPFLIFDRCGWISPLPILSSVSVELEKMTSSFQKDLVLPSPSYRVHFALQALRRGQERLLVYLLKTFM